MFCLRENSFASFRTPPKYMAMLQDWQNAKLHKHLRSYNAAFTFTSTRVQSVGFELKLEVHTYKVQGRFYHLISGMCRNPSFGLGTKVRGCKVASQDKDPEVTSHPPRSAKVSQPHFKGMWGWHSHSRNGDLRVLRDSWKFRTRLQGSKHLALKCSLYHWKGLEV